MSIIEITDENVEKTSNMCVLVDTEFESVNVTANSKIIGSIQQERSGSSAEMKGNI